MLSEALAKLSPWRCLSPSCCRRCDVPAGAWEALMEPSSLLSELHKQTYGYRDCISVGHPSKKSLLSVIVKHHLNICPLVHLSSLLDQDPFFLKATRSFSSHFVYSSASYFPTPVFSSSSGFSSFQPFSLSFPSQPPGCPQMNIIPSITAADQRTGLQGPNHASIYELSQLNLSLLLLPQSTSRSWKKLVLSLSLIWHHINAGYDHH